MKAHTNNFKEELKIQGREFTDILTYNGQTLSGEQLNSVNYSYKSSLMKTVMKELTIDTNVEMKKGDTITYQLGLKVGNSYEYLNYGNYLVEKVEKQEDKKSWLVTCYDKMLITMVDYVDLEITYPITIRNYIKAICDYFSITFKNRNSTFVNYNKTITNERYLDSDGKSLGYTFRDVLDELAQVTGSFIIINSNDELELKYPTKVLNVGNTKNLFTGFKKGKAINSNTGEEYLRSYSATSDYIAVNLTGSNTYTLSGMLSTLRNFIGAYNSNKEFLGRTHASNISSLVLNSSSFSSGTPQGTGDIAYIRVQEYEFTGLDGVIDDIDNAKVQLETGSTITDYVPYYDTIDEEYFNDVNVNVGKRYGPINSIIFSRSSDSDNIGLTDNDSITKNGLCEVKISENQILNDNNRSDYLQGLFDELNGLYYYINDYDLKGILYYEVGDIYYATIFGNTYQSLLLSDEINRSSGIKETIYSEEPETSVSDYKSIDTTNKKINKTYLIVNKQEGQIEGLVSRTDTIDTTINNNYQELTQKFNGYTPVSRTVEIENTVTTLQTDTYTKTQIDTKLIDGSVQKVMTMAGTFDIDGMHYEKTNAKTSTTINEVGVGVKKTSDTNYVLFAGYVDSNNAQYSDFQGQTLVASENMLVENYFVIGTKSRMEDYENGTGMFYIGG